MVNIVNKSNKWLGGYRAHPVTRKLRQTGRRKKLTFNHHPQQQSQGPSEALEIVVEDTGGENEPRTPVSIKDKLKQARQDNEACSWAKLSIYRIPHNLKHGEDKAYVPQIVSLGPYHHGKKGLRQMDRHKWRCIDRILTRTNRQIGLYLDTVKEVEQTARACYEGTISMSTDEFVEMMVLDGCFVIELFQGVGVNEGFKKLGYPHNDPVFSMQGSIHTIRRDMIMLENQIPFFILDRLLVLQLGDSGKGLVAKLALRFFESMKPMDSPPTNVSSDGLKFDTLPDQDKLHCLQLFRQSLLHPGPTETGAEPSLPDQDKLLCLQLFRQSLLHPGPTQTGAEPSLPDQDKLRCLELFWQSLLHPGPTQTEAEPLLQRRQQFIHSVTELREAGIKFSKRNTDRFWDIKFEGGCLQIPRLVIHDATRSLFLNLIAHEQCHFNCSNHITAYVIFMDNLINSPEDVRHLHDCEIIEHWLGSDAEVADLFNRLCQEVVFDNNDSYLSALSVQVNNYSGHSWYRWGFLLKHKYFSNPWSITSFIAAVLLLVLTFAQTFYGIYGYYRPGS